MGLNKGDIVVCTKLDDYGHLEMGKKYEICESIEMSDQHVIQIVDYNSGKSLGFYSMNNFTQIDEWRDEKIKKILEQ